MIVYLRNEEIDRDKWDGCLAEMPGIRPYPWSWYLDIMAPGWEALVDDDYDALFPLPAFRKYGFRYVASPLFLQQLGAFAPDGDRTGRAAEFISFIPEFFRLVELSVGQAAEVPGYSITPRTNFELRLADPYESLWFNYSTDCRRNINIAHRFQQEIVNDVTPHEIIALFRNNIGRRAGVIRETNYRRLHHLMDFCTSTGRGRLVGVRSPKGKLLWGMFLIDTMNRITLLFTAGSRKSRELRTAYHVIDSVINESAGSGKTVDFAGSSVPSIALFMKSFGGIKTTYYRLFRNTLPWPVRLLK
jgi:hypothetical protein